MPRGQPRTAEEKAAGPLAALLLDWGRDHGLSMRGMSVAAGLRPDALRNLTRKPDFKPTARTLAAFAGLMNVPVEALLHPERPLPEPPPAPAAAKKYRTFAPTPVKVEDAFNDTELAVMAALGMEVEDGPRVFIHDPMLGERVPLAPAWYGLKQVRQAVLEHVERAAEALRAAMGAGE